MQVNIIIKGDIKNMALIKCKECGKEISAQAKSCPHCGYVEKDICIFAYNKRQENLLKSVNETKKRIEEIDKEYYYKYGI